jgi:hypothetical protein
VSEASSVISSEGGSILEGTADRSANSAAPEQPELLALFRLLMKQPPREHDCRTCPICKRYGIDEI